MDGAEVYYNDEDVEKFYDFVPYDSEEEFDVDFEVVEKLYNCQNCIQNNLPYSTQCDNNSHVQNIYSDCLAAFTTFSVTPVLNMNDWRISPQNGKYDFSISPENNVLLKSDEEDDSSTHKDRNDSSAEDSYLSSYNSHTTQKERMNYSLGDYGLPSEFGRKCTPVKRSASASRIVESPKKKYKGRPGQELKQQYSKHVSRKRKESAKFYDSKLLRDTGPVPLYENHQLLGDSQFLRFAQQFVPTRTFKHARQIGYCLSGQKIFELLASLLRREYKLHPNVILLIGTNDIVRRTNLNEMFKSYKMILDYLKSQCEKIVLLTIPPVPKLEMEVGHWHNLETFNNFILEQKDGQKVHVVDIAHVYITYNNKCCKDYFEPVCGYGLASREDLIHLNKDGFKLLRCILDIKYFKKQ